MFVLTEEQELLRNSVSSFLAGGYDFDKRRTIIESKSGWSTSVWYDLAQQLGLFGAAIPESHGGFGGGMREIAIVMEEIGRSLVVEPVLESLALGTALLRHAAGPAMDTIIPGIMDGSVRLSLAIAEPAARYTWHDISTRAADTGRQWQINGHKAVVVGAPIATHHVVTVRMSGEQRDRDGVTLLLVPADAVGVTRRDYRTIDARVASELYFKNVMVGHEGLLGTAGAGLPVLDKLLDELNVALCAEASGVLRRLLDLTVEYTRQRKQFGVSLSSFQVLQHKMVDMSIMVEKSTALTTLAAAALAQGDPHGPRLAAAAKAFTGESCRIVGQSAVQLHGGMGTTDELAISHYFKRATVIERQFGSSDHHVARYADLTFRDDQHAYPVPAGVSAGPMESDLNTVGDDLAFRAEIRRFIAGAFDDEMRALAARQAGLFAEGELQRRWHRALYERGWIAPAWPKEYGGPGWTLQQQHIFHIEVATAGLPNLPGFGLGLCGPVVMQFGTPEQKAFFLPRILSNEFYFCQGYSEPQSGSDLASLQTRAVRDGDDYIVNGTKLWTTHAHFANWIFLLVRTGTEGRPQQGITFLVTPLDMPGITITPIRSMSGEHELNQVFFDDVRIPVANRFGEENAGWGVAKYLLEFERGGDSPGVVLRVAMDHVKAVAARQPGDNGAPSLLQDPMFRSKIARLDIEILAAEALDRQLNGQLATGNSVGPAASSIKKLLVSECGQQISELLFETLGIYGVPDQRGSLNEGTAPPIGPDYAATPAAKFLNGRATTIFGGSSQIQRNILAKVSLRL